MLNGERYESATVRHEKPVLRDEAGNQPTKDMKREYGSLSIPEIELVPSNITLFKKELIRTKRAHRTFYYLDKPEKKEIWKADNFSPSSDLMSNIKTNNQFRSWKSTGLIKVRLEIIE
jgi:hypothetical protein